MRTPTPRAALATVLTTGLVVALVPLGARASSHREAPFVTERPKTDATDFYMFVSYEPGRSDFVTLIANYQPLQDAYGGPNYFTMDPDATYDIHIDRDGDSVEDVTFRFRFQNELDDIALSVGDPGAEKLVSIPLRAAAPISDVDTAGLNERESFTVDVIEGPVTMPRSKPKPLKNAVTGTDSFLKPLDNVGTKTIQDYEGYAAAHVYEVAFPGFSQTGRLFVGQRKDPFVVNLGETFDLVNLNPLGAEDGGTDSLADKNVTSLILEVPRTVAVGPNGLDVIGGWTSARLPADTLLVEDPSFEEPEMPQKRALRQVSRLGMPLVNEVVIGLKDKNLFNASAPQDDGQFLDYVTHPTLPELLEALFGVQAPNLFPRDDLVQVFLTGVPGLNQNGATSEMQRLNWTIAPTPLADQERLGVLAGDLAGFPNGRRPGDDVVDSALRVVMGALLDPTSAPDGQLPYTDGAIVDATYFDGAFPYLRTPLPGAPR